MHHFHNLVSNVGGFIDTVIFRNQRRSPNSDITQPHLTSAIALSMISSKTLYQHARELIFTTHEHALPRYKDILKNNQSLVTSKLRIARINFSTFH